MEGEREREATVRVFFVFFRNERERKRRRKETLLLRGDVCSLLLRSVLLLFLRDRRCASRLSLFRRRLCSRRAAARHYFFYLVEREQRRVQFFYIYLRGKHWQLGPRFYLYHSHLFSVISLSLSSRLTKFQMHSISGARSCYASPAAATVSQAQLCNERRAPRRANAFAVSAATASSVPSTSSSSQVAAGPPPPPLRSTLPHLRSPKHASSFRTSSLTTHAVKRRNEKHIVCSKTLVATAGKESLVDEACAKLVAAVGLSGPQASPATAAAANRRGVIEFSYGRDSYEPNVFHFWERYESNVALGRHNTREDAVAFLEALTKEGLLEGPVGMVLYEWRDGQLGPACAQGGSKGEGGRDDATGGSGMAGGAGLKQTSATLDLVRFFFEFFVFGFRSRSMKKIIPKM